LTRSSSSATSPPASVSRVTKRSIAARTSFVSNVSFEWTDQYPTHAPAAWPRSNTFAARRIDSRGPSCDRPVSTADSETAV